MDQRQYNQFCALATALDHIGDRWTLLVIRELLPGPMRYSDLRRGLPGIATNLLAARLAGLVGQGLVSRRRLPPPAASTVYELTATGRDLEPAILDLVRWGSRWMSRPAEGTAMRASWFGLALQALAQPADLAGITADVEVLADDERIHLHVADGRIQVAAGSPQHADARITASPATLFRVGSGSATLAAEVAAGRATVDGGPGTLELLGRVLHFR